MALSSQPVTAYGTGRDITETGLRHFNVNWFGRLPAETGFE
ncbi:hypothetical protein [Nocardia sp. 2YAB30]